MTNDHFPFPALVGLDALKLALQLAAIDIRLSVLIRGDKGAGKSTAARGLRGLPEQGTPFINLPIGATEDRLLGGIDVEKALRGEPSLKPGLLAAADGGVLYVDEVNLLHDHLVDTLLDAAAMGRATVEREGVSVSHAARFVLIGTMNPEEGELRPQLLDRFGLTVEVASSRDPEQRVEPVEHAHRRSQRHPDHREVRVCGDDARERCREPRTADEDAHASFTRRLRVLGDRVRVAVGAHNPDLVEDPALVELPRCLLHHGHVGLRAHHDADAGVVSHGVTPSVNSAAA